MCLMEGKKKLKRKMSSHLPWSLPTLTYNTRRAHTTQLYILMLTHTHMLAQTQAHTAVHLPTSIHTFTHQYPGSHSPQSWHVHTRPHTSTPRPAFIHTHPHTQKGKENKGSGRKVLPMRSRRFTRLSTSATDVALN